MPNAIGFVDDTSQYANRQMLEFLMNFVDTNGWTILESDLVNAGTRYWIAEGPGYIGPDGPVRVYIGMRSYQDVGSDYYNLSVATFTGYVNGNAFTLQPGYVESGVPAHNQRIDYWASVNDRRLTFALKVGTPVYEMGYAGFILPYATPRQYPYPVLCGGMLGGVPATRFSDTAHSIPYRGNRSGMSLRWVSGAYVLPHAWPWSNGYMAGSQGLRPTGVYYSLPRIVLHDNAANVYGELDGIHYITGFNNAVENTLTIGGVNYVVVQDVWRTGFVDYVAMRLDP
jgi:hypothetical protein